MSFIFECNVWCSENDKNRDLGLPDGDVWMPIAIDLSQVLAIKLAGPNEFIGEDKATIHLPGWTFIVDVEYKSMIIFWKKYLSNE